MSVSKVDLSKEKHDDDGMKEDNVFYFAFHLVFPVCDFTGRRRR